MKSNTPNTPPANPVGLSQIQAPRGLRITNAVPEDEPRVRADVQHCIRRGMDINGFSYNDPLINADGIHLELFVPARAGYGAILSAVQRMCATRDVVKVSVLRCPQAWLARVPQR